MGSAAIAGSENAINPMIKMHAQHLEVILVSSLHHSEITDNFIGYKYNGILLPFWGLC